MTEKTWAKQHEAEVERGVELLKLCHKLQSEKDGVQRPEPPSIDYTQKIDPFTADVNSAITWMTSILELYPQSKQLAALGRKLEADGKINVETGQGYADAVLSYLLDQHGISQQPK